MTKENKEFNIEDSLIGFTVGIIKFVIRMFDIRLLKKDVSRLQLIHIVDIV